MNDINLNSVKKKIPTMITLGIMAFVRYLGHKVFENEVNDLRKETSPPSWGCRSEADYLFKLYGILVSVSNTKIRREKRQRRKKKGRNLGREKERTRKEGRKKGEEKEERAQRVVLPFYHVEV